MSDLVQRLRNHTGTSWKNEAEAADEIERLRARVAELEAVDYDAIARRMAQVMFETPVSYAISDIKVTDRTREMLGGDDAVQGT